MQLIVTIGESVRDAILSAADLLKAEHVPGLVSVGLVLLLVGLMAGFAVWQRKSANALIDANEQVTAVDDEQGFLKNAPEIDAHFAELKRKGNPAQKAIATAWTEYRDTNVLEAHDGAESIHNALRPSMFFNIEDMGLSARGWRIWPGLFVTVGLALTFLGLIAALQQTSGSLEAAGQNQAAVSTALQGLLTIASAKFIMSLTGLVCSIVFTIVLRVGLGKLEKAVHALCNTLESRLSYVSLEELSMDQLAAIRSQNDHMTKLNTELIAELGRPLREELPAVISKSIQEAMTPVMESVGRAGSEGMGDMVRDLSTRFSQDVGEALRSASARLAEAGDRLGQLAERMDDSSARVGSEMDRAVARVAQAVEELRDGMANTAEQTNQAFASGVNSLLGAMNQTLQRIGQNTADSAQALQLVAESLVEAATSFREQINTAGSEAREAATARMALASEEAAGTVTEAGAKLLESFRATIGAVSERAEQLSGKAGEELLRPLEDLRRSLEGMVGHMSTSTERMSRFSDGVKQGADAAESAAGTMRTASQSLASAAAPVRDIAAKMEAAATGSAEASRAAAETVRGSSERVARNAADTLAAAQEILGAERLIIEGSLGAVNAALGRFEDVTARYDDMDEKLGEAFATFQEEVGRSIAVVRDHSEKVHQKYAGALDQLREVVDQAQAFIPESVRV